MALETRILVKAAWTLADRCGGLESGLGARSPVKDLRDATPDGLRRSAFREGFAVRTRVSGAVDLKAVGRKPSGEDFRVATPDGLRRSAFREAFAARTTVFGADQSARVRKDRTMKRVRPEGFEPSTLGSEDRCAIQLRHGRITKLSLTDAVKILKGGNRQLEKPWEGCF